MDGAPENRFTLDEALEQSSREEDLQPGTAQAPAAASIGPDDLARAHAAAATAAYCWNVIDDTMTWSSNAHEVLRCDAAALSTGRKFAELLDSDNIASRYDTVMGSGQRDTAGDGVAFQIEYCFRPKGRANPLSLWLEDSGRWHGAADAGPAMVYGTIRVVGERQAGEPQTKNQADFDPLTGMMNRSRMIEALDETIAITRSEKSTCAFALLAVKNLNIMNETYGFEVADEVIAAIAQRLRRVMRTGDGVARYSGSKFGIILKGCQPGELAPALERFMRAVRDNVIETSLGPIWALLSIGAVNLPALGETARAAAAYAEEALSEALRQPNDGYVIYSSSEKLKEQRLLNARCASEIVECLREGRFKLAFQPVSETATGKTLFHEALLRMQDSSGTLVEAGHLVPMAENLGLIRLIDRAVVQTALAVLARRPQARLSVNISATTVKDPRWNTQILDLIAGAPELADRLIFEVTEAAALGSIESALACLREMRKAGCGIAIDDFGAGFTAHKRLQELPFTLIKLDAAFCRDLASPNGNTIYVRSMVELAHSLGISVVAKQVETEADAATLLSLGVDLIQGNIVGLPSVDEPWEDTADEALHWTGAEDGLQPTPEPDAAPDQKAADTPPVMVGGDSADASSAALSVDGEPALTAGDADDHLARLHHILQELQKAIASAAKPDENLPLAS